MQQKHQKFSVNCLLRESCFQVDKCRLHTFIKQAQFADTKLPIKHSEGFYTRP